MSSVAFSRSNTRAMFAIPLACLTLSPINPCVFNHTTRGLMKGTRRQPVFVLKNALGFTDFQRGTFHMDVYGISVCSATDRPNAMPASASRQLNPSSQPLTTVIACTSGLFGGVESGGAAQGIASVIRIGWQNTCYPPSDGGKTSAPVWSFENKPCRRSSRY